MSSRTVMIRLDDVLHKHDLIEMLDNLIDQISSADGDELRDGSQPISYAGRRVGVCEYVSADAESAEPQPEPVKPVPKYTVTLRQLDRLGASPAKLRQLCKHLGKPVLLDDEPIPITEVLYGNGLSEAIWCAGAMDTVDFTIAARKYALWCAERVRGFVDDPRVDAAIAVVEAYVGGIAEALCVGSDLANGVDADALGRAAASVHSCEVELRAKARECALQASAVRAVYCACDPDTQVFGAYLTANDVFATRSRAGDTDTDGVALSAAFDKAAAQKFFEIFGE